MQRVKFMCAQCCKIRSKPQGSDRHICYVCRPKTANEELYEMLLNKPKDSFKVNPFATLKV